MKAFTTHTLHGSYPHYKAGAQIDEDDDLPTLLRRSRKLPGRILTVRTADGRHMSHRPNAPSASVKKQLLRLSAAGKVVYDAPPGGVGRFAWRLP